MAKRRKRRSTRTKKKDEYPGWAWGVWGLAIGLSVAAAIWVSDRRGQPIQTIAASEHASPGNALDDNGETATPDVEPKKRRFDFYTILPSFEVVIPEEDPEVVQDTAPKAIEAPGTYVLQAGSFTAYEDADRRRAQLALHGMNSGIQKVSIDENTYHRVRIGPTQDLDELNMQRSRLRAAKIDVLIIRLGD